MIKERILTYINKYPKIREYVLYRKHQIDALALYIKSYTFSNKINKRSYLIKRKKYDNYIRNVVDCAHRWSKKLNDFELITGDHKLEDYDLLSINGDSLGKALKKGDIYYRGIYKHSLKDFQKIWERGIYHALGEYRLMPKIEITNLYTDEFPLIIKVETYEFIPFSTWSFNMVRDACILMAVLKDILAELDCTLVDGHMNNVTFLCGKPMLSDVGSIMLSGLTGFQEEVVFTGCFHLLELQLGNSILSRMDLYDIDNNMTWLEPRHYGLQMDEYYHSVKRMKRIYRFKSNHLGRKIFHRVFALYQIEPAFIDVLFPPSLPLPDACSDAVLQTLKKIILQQKNINSVIEINGFSGELTDKLLKGGIVTKGNYIDYNETKVDSAFSKGNIDHTLLINYLYPYDKNVLNIIKSDLAICVDPLSNPGSYQGFDVSSILINTKKLSKKFAAFIIYPNHEISKRLKGASGNICGWFENRFNKYFNLVEKIYSKNNIDDNDYFVIYLGYPI